MDRGFKKRHHSDRTWILFFGIAVLSVIAIDRLSISNEDSPADGDKRLTSLTVEVDFQNATLDDVLKDFADQTGVLFDRDDRTLSRHPDVLRRTVTARYPHITIGSFLSLFLEADQLGVLEQKNRLVITERKRIQTEQQSYVFRLTNHGLTAKHADSLKTILHMLIDEHDPRADFRISQGELFLTSHQQTANDVETLLEQLGAIIRHSDKGLSEKSLREKRIQRILKHRPTSSDTSRPLDSLLMALSKEHEIPIWIDYPGLKTAGINPQIMVRQVQKASTLSELLDDLIAPLGAAWYVDREVILITSKENVTSRYMVKCYNLERLGEMRAQRFVDRVSSIPGTGPWRSATHSGGECYVYGRFLIVRQHGPSHRRITQALSAE